MKNIDKIIIKMKNSKKIKTFTRKTHTYTYMEVNDYNKLKPLTYTILKKKNKVITKINGKIETTQILERGDYVLSGKSNEKYGHKLEKILGLYDLGKIRNKIVKRKGFKVTEKNINIPNKKLSLTASWGEKQNIKQNDYILFENTKGYYGIEEKAFKKTYV